MRLAPSDEWPAASAATASRAATAPTGHHLRSTLRSIATAPRRQSTPANCFARANTSSSIPGVNRPVKVFCWLTW